MPTELKLPIASVSLQDGEELIEPAQGDSVSVTIEGTVQSLQDGSVTVYAESANGMPLEGDQEKTEPTVDEEAEMIREQLMAQTLGE